MSLHLVPFLLQACLLATWCHFGFGYSKWHPGFSLRLSLGLSASVIEGNYYKAFVQDAVQSIKGKVSQDDKGIAFANQVSDFVVEYATSSQEAKVPIEQFESNVQILLESIGEAMVKPYKFQPFHQMITEPLNYYKWGNDFLRPLVIDEQSDIFNTDVAQEIEARLKAGDNVALLSNHQTEVDPQVLSILLEKVGLEHLAKKCIFIAGHKVTNDPIAIPFSMGRNLLCIHSKKHIKNPPEKVQQKQAQNMAAMAAMGELFASGGNLFWVAPSGGRDRPDPQTARVVVAPFDNKVLDMFKILKMQSGKGLHFYPMAMYTHQLVPPPNTLSSSLGEPRSAKRGAVSLKFLPATDGIGGLKDKAFTSEVEASVKAAYEELINFHDGNK